MKTTAAVLLALLFIFVPTGCRPQPESSLPVTPMQIAGENFNLEIATSFHDQEVGLMYRDHLDADHGMIFVSAKEQGQTFWNHDVHFPLDLIFMDAGGTIVSLKHMDAYSDKNTSSDAPAKYVIELNAGTVNRLKLKVGDRLTVPKPALNP